MFVSRALKDCIDTKYLYQDCLRLVLKNAAKLKTRLTPVNELKAIFAETLLNNTSTVNKINDESLVSGISFGIAKVSQKAVKDLALVEAHILVDSAYGSQLDDIADARGVSPRFTTSQSSTYVRVVGDPGTVYTATINTVTGRDGQVFDIEESLTLGIHGFGFIKIRSQLSGEDTSVDPLTLDTVTPEPSGHSFLVNEFAAFGGRDVEDDDLFKKRIKEGANLGATSTISKLTQVINKIDPNVMRVFYHGTNIQGQIVLAVATQNGIDLTTPELNDIENRADEFLAVSDLKAFNASSGNIELKNIEYQTIDLTFRVELLPAFDPDAVRIDMQGQISNHLDFRFWKSGDKVEWDELLRIVKNTEGVRSVPDTKFIPNVDVVIDKDKLPRIRSFTMLDLQGNIISDVQGVLNPTFYPSNPDSSFQQTILASI